MWKNRRQFLTDGLYLSGGVALAPKFSFLWKEELQERITILHTNDTHSHIDPFPDNDAKYPGKGGISRRAGLVKEIRNIEDNVLLLDAGDIFQGTPYFNRFGGVLELKLMTELGYDAATMGNHDFDGGMDGFIKAKQYAEFPFLCSNYDFSQTALKGLTKTHTTFKKGKLKIGVFGLGIELDGLVEKTNYLDTTYLDPIEIAREQVEALQKEKCDLIICLSHLGYDYEDKTRISDLNLALNTDGIHLIIGGHTHTFLSEPTIVKNRLGEAVLINQVGWAGIQLGRVDFVLRKDWTHRSQKLIID